MALIKKFDEPQKEDEMKSFIRAVLVGRWNDQQINGGWRYSPVLNDRSKMHGAVVINAAYCKQCFSIIESTHRHEFFSCECRAISVDGGQDYIKRVWDSNRFKHDECLLDLSIGWPEWQEILTKMMGGEEAIKRSLESRRIEDVLF